MQYLKKFDKFLSEKFGLRGKTAFYLIFGIIFGSFVCATPAAFAQDSSQLGSSNPVVLIVIVGTIALAPFALIMMTSFVKISIVLAILRNALGTQQAPPNQVITGISLILSIFIMSPVIEKMRSEADPKMLYGKAGIEEVVNLADKVKEPLRDFLLRNTKEANRALFLDLAQRMAVRNKMDPNTIQANEFRVIVPAFVTSELTKAFEIGFMLFIPFLVIDMIVSNILQAMGMFMLSPTTISLPFKLLLFVLSQGWEELIKRLVLSYQ
jgi:type III secretion protein R